MKIFRATVEDATSQSQVPGSSRFFELGTLHIEVLFLTLKGTEKSIQSTKGQFI